MLPFSYNGAYMFGSASSAVFTVRAYTGDDVKNSNVQSEAQLLNTEISDISTMLPNAKIIVVGHSNGGLIAERWWWLYGQSTPRNVVHVFSLDFPINGVYDGTVCLSNKTSDAQTCNILGAILPVSNKLLTTYGELWRSQAGLDKVALSMDKANGLYTPIVTLGDPLYDETDYGARQDNQSPGACNYATQGTNIGWASQGLINGCHFSIVDEVEVVCNGALSIGGVPCYDGSSPLFGLTPLGDHGDLYLHSWVKNSTVTITSVMRYVTG